MSETARRAPFRLFEITIGVYLPVDAPLPGTFAEWLERAIGGPISDNPAVPTTLERIVEKRYPLAGDVIEKRTDRTSPYA